MNTQTFTNHVRFQHSHDGASHKTYSRIDARRVFQKYGTPADQAQLEIRIDTTKRESSRVMSAHASMILSPDDALRLAATIAPELLEALMLLKEAVEYTPLGERGIKAVAYANSIIAKARGES